MKEEKPSLRKPSANAVAVRRSELGYVKRKAQSQSTGQTPPYYGYLAANQPPHADYKCNRMSLSSGILGLVSAKPPVLRISKIRAQAYEVKLTY